MKIVFLSHTPRNSVFKVGSYHLSREFVRMGHEVLYIPSALSPFHFINVPGMLRSKEYIQSLKDRMATLSPVKDKDGVLNLTPFIWIPFDKGVSANLASSLNRLLPLNRIEGQLKNTGFDTADVVIQDKPGLFFLHKFIRTSRWIYRATDNYSSMDTGAGSVSVQKLEQAICSYAHQVIVTSEPLRDLFRKRYGVEAEVIRNGVDADHFRASFVPPREYISIPRPRILYVGSLDQRFDLDLLLQTAELNTAYHFIIVGPGSKERIPAGTPNIHALGARPYSRIPAYMQHADVGIFPLKLTEANHARSPMKMYEYGISGLPVVSTPLNELQAREEKFIHFANDAIKFYEQIQYSIDHREQLSDIARQRSGLFSWNTIAERLLTSAKQLPETP